MRAFSRIFPALVSALALTLVFSAGALAQPSPPNVGVFDLQKVFSDSQKGKDVKRSLEADFKKRQDELKKKEDEIKKLSTELRQLASSGSANNDDLRKKDENLKNKVVAYQEQLGKYNEEMRKAEEQKMKPLMDSVVKTAGDLAKERGYLLVLETQRAGVVFSMDNMDMTADIIKAIDRKK
ncbi:MAG: OmpH family outer membrane protein [Candidatus Adiutrix sp.]|jgi:outer membrane protein|nr:OmpH family outer membrane protein [Candidatus Adiutrix sp.]